MPFVIRTPLLLNGTFTVGTPIDLIWTAGLLIIAISAVLFQEFPTVDPESQMSGIVAHGNKGDRAMSEITWSAYG